MKRGTYIRTEKIRHKISVTSSGRKHSEESKKKISLHSAKITRKSG